MTSLVLVIFCGFHIGLELVYSCVILRIYKRKTILIKSKQIIRPTHMPNIKPNSPNEALDKLHPLLCVFVVSVDEKGKPNGMTASWFFQTSFEPPMVAVAIGKDKFTYNLIKDSKEFVIAVPNKKLIKTALIFGHTSGKDTDKFEKSGVKTS